MVHRLPGKDVPFMVWMLNENDIDFSELSRDQLCNQFEGIHHLTTKQGICELSKEGHLIEADLSDVTPRSYNLGDPNHRDEFIDDFRITAAINLLKAHMSCLLGRIFYSDSVSSSSFSVSRDILRLAYRACRIHLAIKSDGAWPQVDELGILSDKCLMSDERWHALVEAGYELGSHLSDIPYNLLQPFLTDSLHLIPFPNIPYSDKKRIRAMLYRHLSSFDHQLTAVLRTLSLLSRQFFVDGLLNMWVIKSPDSSCGVGIRIFHRLDDILDCERGMGCRTAQKYIETPLLSPVMNSNTNDSASTYSNYKFDMRVWVAVTSLDPSQPRATIYSSPYGRRCAVPYSLHPSSFSNDLCHLTNYSLQKTQTAGGVVAGNSNGSSNNGDSNRDRDGENKSTTLSAEAVEVIDITPSSNISSKRRGSLLSSSSSSQQQSMVTKMRSTMTNNINSHNNNNIRRRGSLFSASSSRQTGSSKSENNSSTNAAGLDQQSSSSSSAPLLDQELLLMCHDEILQCLPDYNDDHNSNTWTSSIWPTIKRHISCMIALTSLKAIPRLNSFQLLGVDILLDNNFHPWLLEVNMSPAMAHRSDRQSRLIRRMSHQFVQLAIAPKLPLDLRQRLGETMATVSKEKQDEDNDVSSLGNWEDIPFFAKPTVKETEDNSSHYSVTNDPLYPRYKPQSGHQSHNKANMNPNNSGFGFTVVNDNTNNITENGFNISFALVGRSISKQAICHLDHLHHTLAMITRLQTRLRLFLFHRRRYHSNRLRAAILLQCAERCRQARHTLNQRLIHRSALTLQRFGRLHVMVKRRQRLSGSELRLQARVKERLLLRRLCRWRLCFLSSKQRVISTFILFHLRRRLWKYLRRFLKYRRLFLCKKRQYRLMIFHCLRLYYLRRKHAKNRLFLFMQTWLRQRLENQRKRRLLVASLIYEAKEKARLLQWEKDNINRELLEMARMDIESRRLSELLSYHRQEEEEREEQASVLKQQIEAVLLSARREREQVKAEQDEYVIMSLDDALYGPDPCPTMAAQEALPLPLPSPVKEKAKGKEEEYSLLDFVQHAEDQQRVLHQSQSLSSVVRVTDHQPLPPPSPSQDNSENDKNIKTTNHQRRHHRPYRPSDAKNAAVNNAKNEEEEKWMLTLSRKLQSRDQLQLEEDEKINIAAHSSSMADRWLMSRHQKPLQAPSLPQSSSLYPSSNYNHGGGGVRDSLEDRRQEKQQQKSFYNNGASSQQREQEQTQTLAAYLDSIHLTNANLYSASSNNNRQAQSTIIGSRPRPRSSSGSSLPGSSSSMSNLCRSFNYNYGSSTSAGYDAYNNRQQQRPDLSHQWNGQDEEEMTTVTDSSLSRYQEQKHDDHDDLQPSFFAEDNVVFLPCDDDNNSSRSLSSRGRNTRSVRRPSSAGISRPLRPEETAASLYRYRDNSHHRQDINLITSNQHMVIPSGADDFFTQAFVAAESPLDFNRHNNYASEIESFGNSGRKKGSKKTINRPKSANGASVKAKKKTKDSELNRIAAIYGYY